jgi:hypothetical protein
MESEGYLVGKTGRSSAKRGIKSAKPELPVLDMRPILARGVGKLTRARIRAAVKAVLRGRPGKGGAGR